MSIMRERVLKVVMGVLFYAFGLENQNVPVHSPFLIPSEQVKAESLSRGIDYQERNPESGYFKIKLEDPLTEMDEMIKQTMISETYV